METIRMLSIGVKERSSGEETGMGQGDCKRTEGDQANERTNVSVNNWRATGKQSRNQQKSIIYTRIYLCVCSWVQNILSLYASEYY